MMKRSFYNRVALLVLLLPLLAACGGQEAAEVVPTLTAEPTATPTTRSTSTSVPTATPTSEPTATPTSEPTATSTSEPTATPELSEEISDQSGETGATYPLLTTSYLEFGAASHLFYTDRERALQLAQNAGLDWIRQQVHWKDIEWKADDYGWEELDRIIDAVDARGLRLLVSIVRSPTFYTADGSDGLPANPKDMGDFVEDMARRYGDKIDAYQIWNEQNLAHETGGSISVEDAGNYVELLMECYQRIKAVSPNAYVVTGAPSPTGIYDPTNAVPDVAYLNAMYSYRDGIIRDYFDAQGVHAAGSANPPETLWPDNPSSAEGWTDDATFYFRNVENVRGAMEANGMGDHQLWITEFGWATENETPGYEYGYQVSFEQQGDYIRRAIEMTYEQYPWVGVMFIWNLNFAVTWGETDPPQPLHEQASFSILNPDWSPRPSYLAVQDTIAKIKQEQGR